MDHTQKAAVKKFAEGMPALLMIYMYMSPFSCKTFLNKLSTLTLFVLHVQCPQNICFAETKSFECSFQGNHFGFHYLGVCVDLKSAPPRYFVLFIDSEQLRKWTNIGRRLRKLRSQVKQVERALAFTFVEVFFGHSYIFKAYNLF